MKIKLFVHAKYRHHAKSPAVTANTVVPFCFRYRPSFPASHLLAVDPHSFFTDPDPAVLLNADPDPVHILIIKLMGANY